MTHSCRRSGSALIIVLGFLSFMVVSAVAFAVYMRTERVASSGFHRSVAVRQMVKAGVANAVAQIDAAIGRDPFPGLPAYPGSGGNLGLDYWTNCVFTPHSVASTDQTVPVIPLEGLAYLPPAIINEVRGGARRTHTAEWQNLDYDIGRFAYVAVNVSDFFDVNKVNCGPRYGGSNGRISLAHLFQNNTGTGFASDSNAGKLDTFRRFLERNSVAESQVPFVSLADFNVAMFSKAKDDGASMGVYSPFYNYIKEGNWRALFSIGGGEQIGDSQVTPADRAGRMLFVTDSWYPNTNKLDVLDLSVDQPFSAADFNNAKNATVDILDRVAYGAVYDERLEDDVTQNFMAALYDYLDDNSVPLSLALPNVERVPMIGVVDATSLRLKVKSVSGELTPYPGGNGQAQSDIYVKTTSYVIDGTPHSPMVRVVMMYPFKGPVSRTGEKPSKKDCKVQVLAKMFFADTPGNDPDKVRWSGRYGGLNSRPEEIPLPAEEDWNKTGQAFLKNGCITLVSAQEQVKFKNDTILDMDDSDAVFEQDIKLPSLSSITDLAKKGPDGTYETCLLEVQELIQKQAQGMSSYTADPNYPQVSSFQKILPFKNAAYGNASSVGVVDGGASKSKAKLEDMPYWGKTLTPLVAVWVRVIDGERKTVDMAPANFADDKELNHGSIRLSEALVNLMGDGISGRTMLVAPGKPITFSAKDTHLILGITEAGVELFDKPCATFVAPDPRYNSAPEDFYATTDSLNANGYYSMVSRLLGQEGREPDISMFASDQQYLQSVGEFAFLPWTGRLGDNKDSSYKLVNPTEGFASNFDDMKVGSSHKGMFWRTYHLYVQDWDRNDDQYVFEYFSKERNGGKAIVGDVNGFKVNPYSAIAKIRLAATANTPHDYWASSTNTAVKANKPPCFKSASSGNLDPESMDTCLKHCFNQWSGNVGTMIHWEDVTNITSYVFDQMRIRALSREDWEDTLADLNWYPNRTNPGVIFDGYELRGDDDLFAVDRKTLYSFWHDSMANRQQLFLVFVRVEPIPMGASDNATTDTLPSQQGARAVALVWRDPTESTKARMSPVDWINQEGESRLFGCNLGSGARYVPHRTRLLFYHQFD